MMGYGQTPLAKPCTWFWASKLSSVVCEEGDLLTEPSPHNLYEIEYCSLGLPGAHDSPTPASQELGSQICNTTPGLGLSLLTTRLTAEPVLGRQIAHWCPWFMNSLWEVAHSGDLDLVRQSQVNVCSAVLQATCDKGYFHIQWLRIVPLVLFLGALCSKALGRLQGEVKPGKRCTPPTVASTKAEDDRFQRGTPQQWRVWENLV